MDTQRWERIGDIFEQLLGVPQTQRPNLLDSLCGDDAEMKNIVASMLESEDSVQRFDKGSVTTPVHVGTDRQAQDQIDAALAGTRIGPWRLERKLGTGGMGVVWLAQRADGQFEQCVALKLIKRGMDSDAVLARFLRERQILARLEHPHIAHLIDGGVAEDGRPYFAMEHVDGVPLLRYCHECGAKLEQRITLFLDVCAALQFAHEHHVVHRDLKPSNVLVTAKGEVKLLDFGIAKLIEGDDGIASTLTDMQRERPMTPAYAAPEQIAGGRISEATDVYALGCVLYELLTGQHAHDFSAAAGARDVLRIVQATDPVAPSRLKLVHAPVSLRRLRGDLDTIVLTALKRDPARRYASVATMAADLRNYLGGKPISARRDSVFYRAYKFARRHRAGMAASLAVVAVAAAAGMLELRERAPAGPVAPGSAMAIVDFNNLSQDKQDAWLAPALAEMLGTQLTIGGTLHAVPDELVRPARADLSAPLAGGYARQSLATLRKRLGADYVVSGSYLVSGNAGDAKLHLDLAMQDARTGASIANVVQAGALSDLPVLIAQAGLSLREKSGFAPITAAEKQEAGNEQPPNTEVARRMGLALDALHKSDPARARDELLEAVALAPGYAPAYVQLAQAWKMLGYDAKALAAAQQAAANSANLSPEQQLRIAREVAVQKSEWPKAIELDKQMLAREPQDPEFRLTYIDDLLNAGNQQEANAALAELRKLPGMEGDPRVELKAATSAETKGDTKAQAQHAERALQLAQVRDEPALAAEAKRKLALARNALGEHQEGETLMRQAIADYQKVANPKAEANARTSLANILDDNNQRQAARGEYQRALAIYERIGDQSGLAAIYSNLAILLWSQGDRDAAETAVRRSLDIRRETGNLSGQAWNLTALATMRLDETASDEVMEDFRQAIALDERAGERAHHVFALTQYSNALRMRGELDAAQKICAQMQAETKQLTDPYSVMKADFQCASIARDHGDIATAVMEFERARKLAQDNGYSIPMAKADVELAQIDMAYKRFDSARERVSHAIEKFAAGGEVVGEAAAQSLLALCYAALNEPVKRNVAAARARDLRSSITEHQEVAVVDVTLAQLLGVLGQRSQAVAQLREFAADAEKRQWLGQSLEAKLAALQLLEQGHDPAAATLRLQLETTARHHGFGWVLARLSPTLKPQSADH